MKAGQRRDPPLPLKAWHVFSGDPYDGSLLVFEATRDDARWRGYSFGPWDWDEYIEVRARRAPTWDAYADQRRVIETNDELPDGAPPFYDDEAC
jgi:hypothetical protein